MKGLKRKRLIRRKQLEDVPELIQHIQSLLPVKDAARTCVISKSWLHAWSTIPTLRLCPPPFSLSKQQERRYMRFIRRTIRRRHQDDIPIITCDLYFAIHKQKSATRVEKSIKSVASKSCLKELRLTIFGYIASFTLPDEIFSTENLNTLSIKFDYHIRFIFKKRSLHVSSNPLINCVHLRELELIRVHISEEAFHNLVSTCKLLEKINLNLKYTEGLKKIKVNNLHCLQQLKISPGKRSYYIEIYDVPSLRSFYYDESMFSGDRHALFKIDSIRSLRELYIEKAVFDDAFSDMIKSKFPFLESLTLRIGHPTAEMMNIRCATLQRLKIELWQSMPVRVQVDAPKLRFFLHESNYMPSLLFPTVAPEQIELRLKLFKPIDHLLFLKIWETLNLSSKFNIEIRTYESPVQVQFKIEDVRTSVPFPATNVKNLSFKAFSNNGWCDNSVLLFDAFFSICQPMYVTAQDKLRLGVANYFLKLVEKGVRKNKTGKVYWAHLKFVEMRNGSEGKWEKLTSASVSLLDGCRYLSEFKLTWGSP